MRPAKRQCFGQGHHLSAVARGFVDSFERAAQVRFLAPAFNEHLGQREVE